MTEPAAGSTERADGPIVIATDGSPSATLAVEIGLGLARANGREVVFIHDSPEISSELFEQDPQRINSTDEIAGADPVLRAALDLAKERDVPARLEVFGERGTRDLADAIVGAAAGLGASMIVLGSRGRSSLADAVLGSVSRGVAEAADMPVLIAHRPSRQSSGPYD